MLGLASLVRPAALDLQSCTSRFTAAATHLLLPSKLRFRHSRRKCASLALPNSLHNAVSRLQQPSASLIARQPLPSLDFILSLGTTILNSLSKSKHMRYYLWSNTCLRAETRHSDDTRQHTADLRTMRFGCRIRRRVREKSSIFSLYNEDW